MEAALHVAHSPVHAVLFPQNIVLRLALLVKASQRACHRRFGHAVVVLIARKKAEEDLLRGRLIHVRSGGNVLQPSAPQRQHVRHRQIVARHARDKKRLFAACQRPRRQLAQLCHRRREPQRRFSAQNTLVPVVVIDARTALFIAANNEQFLLSVAVHVKICIAGISRDQQRLRRTRAKRINGQALHVRAALIADQDLLPPVAVQIGVVHAVDLVGGSLDDGVTLVVIAGRLKNIDLHRLFVVRAAEKRHSLFLAVTV